MPIAPWPRDHQLRSRVFITMHKLYRVKFLLSLYSLNLRIPIPNITDEHQTRFEGQLKNFLSVIFGWFILVVKIKYIQGVSVLLSYSKRRENYLGVDFQQIINFFIRKSLVYCLLVCSKVACFKKLFNQPLRKVFLFIRYISSNNLLKKCFALKKISLWYKWKTLLLETIIIILFTFFV